MAERNSTGLLMMLEPSPAMAMSLPVEVREKLAELELELSEGRRLVPAHINYRGQLRVERRCSLALQIMISSN